MFLYKKNFTFSRQKTFIKFQNRIKTSECCRRQLPCGRHADVRVHRAQHQQGRVRRDQAGVLPGAGRALPGRHLQQPQPQQPHQDQVHPHQGRRADGRQAGRRGLGHHHPHEGIHFYIWHLFLLC